MYKLEIELGWLGNGKLTIETADFDIIEVLKEFVEFQEAEGWIGNWEGFDFDEIEECDEDCEEEEEESEEE